MGDVEAIRERLRQRRDRHQRDLQREIERLAAAAAAVGAQRVMLFGSSVWGEPGLTSDLDLLIVWDTPLDFLARTVELYRRLQPQVAMDLLVYTPAEIEAMAHRPLIRKALEEGRVLYEA
jgi:predicted nucleotidyltransferase